MAPALMRRRSDCRLCGGALSEVLDLGDLRLNAFPATMTDLPPKVPHVLTVCRTCGLAQLAHTVPPALMFKDHYWYASAINEAMVKELREVVHQAACSVDLQPLDWVLDIGANDGTLLAQYKDLSVSTGAFRVQTVGVEPADNLQDRLQDHADAVVHDFFPTPQLDARRGSFKIITAIAMAYDLEDPLAFFRSCADLLHPEGVLIVQFQDLLQQIQAAAFDNIVAEHLEYYTLDSLMEIARRAGLRVVDVHTTPINGGSLRVSLNRVDQRRVMPMPEAVAQQLYREHEAGLSKTQIRSSLEAFDLFRERVEHTKRQILAVIEQAAAYGQLWGYGASTKGNTTLQVLELGPADLVGVADRSVEKHGRLTITGIPIVSEETWRQATPKLTLCTIWQFLPGVLQRERAYLEGGGSFLVPLPHAKIIQQTWAERQA